VSVEWSRKARAKCNRMECVTDMDASPRKVRSLQRLEV
jgi:hypothetical protein